jgi:hypothetical protein
MINFRKYLNLDNCILIESNESSKQMETHLTHIEDLAIENGKVGFFQFSDTVELLLKKLQGLESEIDINAKVDGSPALLFGTDPREEYKNQFFIALKYAVDPAKGIIKEGAKLLHSEQEIMQYYGDRQSFAIKLITLFKELSRAYDNSGTIYQCDVLYAGQSDKTIERINEEDYIVFKPNVIAYAIPVDPKSDTYNLVNNSEVGVVVHDSFNATPADNYIRLQQKSRNVNSIVRSGESANVFIMGGNFGQVKIDIENNDIVQISKLLAECRDIIPDISDNFDLEYKTNSIMEFLKIYINKQVDLPNGGIFGQEFTEKDIKKFIKGFEKFLEKRFEILISKRSTEKGRSGQREKLVRLISFLETHSRSMFAFLRLFYLMIKIKKLILKLVEKLTNKLKKTFFLGKSGEFIQTKSEGHVLFNGGTHVKIVDRLEFTKVNRLKGGQR